MGSGSSPAHVGEQNDSTPASRSASGTSKKTAAGLKTDSNQEFDPHKNGFGAPHTPAKRVLSYSTLHKRSVARAESLSSAESDLPSPAHSMSTKRKVPRDSNPSPNSKKRCVTRAMLNGKKNVDYDMKHHPMDDLLRPNAAKKRSIRVWASSAASSTSSNGAPLRKDKLSTPKNLENPFGKPILEAWEDLEPLDRRVYILQKGAPSKGNTLPHKWPKVVSLLVKEQYFTREQFNTWGGIQALEERYETIRVHMMTLFGALEEPMDNKEFVLRYSEGFDVYDQQPRAMKGDGSQLSFVDDSGTDGISHGSEGATGEELTTEPEDNHYSNDENLERAEGMTNESDIDGIESDGLHRYDVYDMMQDYVDNEPDNRVISQPQTAEIRLSDEVSLHASSIGQDDHSEDKQLSSSGTAEHAEQKPGLEREFSDHEVSDYAHRRIATRRSKQRVFDLYEDSAEPGSGGRRVSTAQPVSNDLDPPKENFQERGEPEVEAVTEQLFRDLSNATQRHHSTLSMSSSTSLVSADGNIHLPQQADLATHSISPQDQRGTVTHTDGFLPSPDAGTQHSQRTEPNSSMRNANTHGRKSLRPTASGYL